MRHDRRSSTTTSRPNAIEGSLDVIADACAEVGVRVVVRVRRHRPPRRRRRQARAGRERAVPARRRARAGRRARRVHAAPTTRSTRRPGSPPTSASACTSTSPKAPIDADAGARLAPLARRRLAARALRAPRPRRCPGTIAHNPRSNMNNAVGYARPARFAEPGRARHRRHRRRHARGVPPRLRPPARGRRRPPTPDDGVDVARRTAAQLVPEAARRPRDVDVRRRWSRGTSRSRPACAPLDVERRRRGRAATTARPDPGRRRRGPGQGAAEQAAAALVPTGC